jgi:hypothetical protein
VDLAFSKLEAVLSPHELPAPEILKDLGGYPATARCAIGG